MFMSEPCSYGRLTRRRFLDGMLALGATSLLTACGGGTGAPSGAQATQMAAAEATRGAAQAKPAAPVGATAAPQAAPPGKDVVTIEFWSRFDFLKGAIDLFNEEAKKQGKQVFVNFTTVPGVQMVEKLTAALASRTQPDVMSLDLIQCPYFNSLGAFVDLTDRFNQLPYRDDFSRAMLRLGEYNGKQYQLPFSADNSALIWNKDIFKEAGLDPEKGPSTWAELREFAIKTNSPPDRFGIAFDAQTGGTFMFRWMPYVWSNGGELLNEEGTKSTLNSPQALEALQLWVDLIHKDKVAPPGTHTWSSDDLRAAFQAGKLAMMMNGNFVVALLNRDAPNLSYATTLIPPPSETAKPSSFAGGDTMGILAGTRAEEQAWDLLQFLASEQVQVDFLAKSGIIPIRTSFYANPYFEREPRYQTFTRTLDVAGAPKSVKYNRLLDAFQANLQSALAGSQTPEQALATIEAAHNQVLAE
jgi:multiple sugar transport system substrate-binding protein